MGIFKKDYIVGIDIGSSSVKVAQFERDGGSLQLVRAAIKELKGLRESEGGEKAISDSLKELLKGVDIKNSGFAVVVNCPKTCVRTIITAAMPRKELEDGIKLTAGEYIPFSIDDASLDFEIMGELFEKGVKKQRLLIAASPIATIKKYINILNKAGIEPSSLVPLPIAIQRIVEKSRPKEGEIKATLDMGSSISELAIFSGREIIFCRKIPVAGDDITKSMTGVLLSDMGKTALSLEEAERIKRYIGIPSKADARMIEDKVSSGQVLSMVRPHIEQLASEINRCFDYYREETGGGRIDSLLLFGGGAKLKGLCEFLSQELGIEAIQANPLENLTSAPGRVIENEDAIGKLAPAIGAALGFGRGINLLPKEIKDKTKKTVTRATLFAASTAFILTLLLLYMGMRMRLDILRKRIEVAKQEYSSIEPQLKLAQTQMMANKTLADEPYWDDVFLEISNVIPGEIYLTELSMKDKTILLKGVIEAQAGMEILSDFILALENGIFKDAKLITTKDKKDGTNMFEIKCRVN